MTNYINWMQNNQPIAGDKLPMQGNPVEDHESPATGIASGVAPQGAQYAMVWADVNVTVEAANLNSSATGTALADGKTVALPANTPMEVPNIEPLKTTITMTNL